MQLSEHKLSQLQSCNLFNNDRICHKFNLKTKSNTGADKDIKSRTASLELLANVQTAILTILVAKMSRNNTCNLIRRLSLQVAFNPKPMEELDINQNNFISPVVVVGVKRNLANLEQNAMIGPKANVLGYTKTNQHNHNNIKQLGKRRTKYNTKITATTNNSINLCILNMRQLKSRKKEASVTFLLKETALWFNANRNTFSVASISITKKPLILWTKVFRLHLVVTLFLKVNCTCS